MPHLNLGISHRLELKINEIHKKLKYNRLHSIPNQMKRVPFTVVYYFKLTSIAFSPLPGDIRYVNIPDQLFL